MAIKHDPSSVPLWCIPWDVFWFTENPDASWVFWCKENLSTTTLGGLVRCERDTKQSMLMWHVRVSTCSHETKMLDIGWSTQGLGEKFKKTAKPPTNQWIEIFFQGLPNKLHPSEQHFPEIEKPLVFQHTSSTRFFRLWPFWVFHPWPFQGWKRDLHYQKVTFLQSVWFPK